LVNKINASRAARTANAALKIVPTWHARAKSHHPNPKVFLVPGVPMTQRRSREV